MNNVRRDTLFLPLVHNAGSMAHSSKMYILPPPCVQGTAAERYILAVYITMLECEATEGKVANLNSLDKVKRGNYDHCLTAKSPLA